MAHLQGNSPTDDPNIYGLKFDSEKPRWELLPIEQLVDVVESAKFFTPNGKHEHYPLDITKPIDRDLIVNCIKHNISLWKMNKKKFEFTHHKVLGIAAFEVFFLLRNEPYSEEVLERNYGAAMRWDMFNMEDLNGVANVYTMGAKKYADNNWKKVSADRYYGALWRHLITVHTKNSYDSELGCLHLHQVIWNILALMWIDDNDQKENWREPLAKSPLQKKEKS